MNEKTRKIIAKLFTILGTILCWLILLPNIKLGSKAYYSLLYTGTLFLFIGLGLIFLRKEHMYGSSE